MRHTDDRFTRDPELARLLGTMAEGRPAEADDLDALRLRVSIGAVPELRRRRWRQRARLGIPATLAAGVALMLVVSRPPGPAPESGAHTPGAGPVTTERLLDADVTDDELRAVLSGAIDADDLLLIAAADPQ